MSENTPKNLDLRIPYTRICVKCHIEKPVETDFKNGPADTFHHRICRACTLAWDELMKAKGNDAR